MWRNVKTNTSICTIFHLTLAITGLPICTVHSTWIYDILVISQTVYRFPVNCAVFYAWCKCLC